MMTIEKYEKVLNFVAQKNKTVNENKFFVTLTENENCFSYENRPLDFEICVMDECKNDENDKMLSKFMSNNLDGEWYCMAENLFETFCFLHEIGHMVDDIENGISNEGYEECRNKIYVSRREAFDTYRKIPAEQKADKFALDFINENIFNLWKIIDEKATDEEINFYLND